LKILFLPKIINNYYEELTYCDKIIHEEKDKRAKLLKLEQIKKKKKK